MKAGLLAEQALKLILVAGADVDLEPDEVQDFFVRLNTWMFMLDAQGISLGYTEIETVNDEVTVPPGALFGIISTSAIAAAPFFGGSVVSNDLREASQAGMRAMEILGLPALISAFPSTLPIGSGNEGTNRTTFKFYPDLQQLILAESSGSIALEDHTTE